MLAALTSKIESAILAAIRERYGIDPPKLSFTTPPKIELGELALPVAFELSRKLKRPPREIAAELAEAARGVPEISKADVAGGGYINLYLDRGRVAAALASSVAAGRHGLESAGGLDGKIVVEHTNINPNKAAHIGHLRNAAIGDTFVRCLRFLGHHVEVQNYLDNTGVQVADVVVGLERMEGKSLEQVRALDGKFDYYCWDVYARVSEFYRLSEENAGWRSRTLQAIEAGGNRTAELADHVAMRILEAHLATMARINVAYDLLPRESEILHLHFWEKAFALLKERNAVYYVDSGKNRGCWVMRVGEAEGSSEATREALEEEEKIIVRSDGTVTYVGKDIAYQLWKFGLLGLDFHYRPYLSKNGRSVWITTHEPVPGTKPPSFGHARRVYNVIDARQSYLQGIVLQGLEALGYHDAAANSIHFSYEMVALTPVCCADLGFELSDEDKRRAYVEVSGRKGIGVKADDLLDTLGAKALAEVQSRHALSEDESRAIATRIAVGALRYFLLRYARNTIIAFDFKEALSFDGETGPYVQYAAVRADNIFRKLRESGGDDVLAEPVDAAALGGFLAAAPDVWELLYHAARLPETVRQVAASLEMAQLAKYAFHLAQRFNLFYHGYHILSEPERARRRILLLVVEIVRRQLGKALELLGCEVPPRM